ncbi:23S rRNA pseudouridine1911/1915/1917 synthase [Ruminococcaceae bacterium YRB3002]|nr:23S rRNA pseudouridine1911/1915/1917 synthase [Ruminococcaceae bacterium YRB3002]
MILEFTNNGGVMRLDVAISAHNDTYSRSYFKTLISDSKVTVNGKTVTKAGTMLENGDKVSVDIPDPVSSDNVPQAIPLDIVYEDEHLIIINKPQGMVVHPGAGHKDGTLVNALLDHCDGKLSDINGVLRPGIVHRIDKDTSGLMLACKDNETHVRLASMIADHEVIRKYRAIVSGVIKSERGTIDAPIGRASGDRRKMTVKGDGKYAVTHYEVVNRYTEATDLLLKLETGRTHQIRVHMNYIGHPIVGDPVYGSKKLNRFGLEGQALHSTSIEFDHPITGEHIYYEADVPEYYREVLSRLTPMDN